MRPQKVEDTELLNGLFSVLRSKGYDGASLNELASSSGLQKASLYHRFPGGKKDIALAVINFVKEWKVKNIVNVINDRSIPVAQRLNTVIEKIDQVYESGEATCIMRALSMGSGHDIFSDELQNATDQWIESLTKLGVDVGFDQVKASELALQTLVKIQGSLIVSKTMNSTIPFKKALGEIKESYS